MLEIDKILAATPKELEGLSWYEIVSKLGVLSFNSQGNKPIEIIAKSTRVTAASKVLIVGCGAGGTAVHLAEITGARVHGIDISPESIKTANDLAAKSPAKANIYFQIGDAHVLTFPPNTFDLVITEYMAFFLRPSAFEGFFRVLKLGGHIALAELVKDPTVNANADAKIIAAEEAYAELLGYKFHIPLITDFSDWLGRAGFEPVHVEERVSKPSTREQVKRVGGWKNLFKISQVMLKLMYQSPALRKKFLQMGRVKRVLYQSRSTAKYIFQAILAARKPG
jgi:ubiquinone/menaquinone biosynthesis C-methylase UbiE